LYLLGKCPACDDDGLLAPVNVIGQNEKQGSKRGAQGCEGLELLGGKHHSPNFMAFFHERLEVLLASKML
jgi:hypothetical protein